MKKTLISALTTALVVGAASTTFAAANPFEDVPADHWAYDAVAQLAADGVIEGYGDGTYRGDQEITRYEMAQMVARAMAKGGGDKALIDKLAAEFADELNNLGVRVAALEKKVDNVKWKGWVGYENYTTITDASKGGGRHVDQYLQFQLNPVMTINKNWIARARLKYATDMNSATNAGGKDITYQGDDVSGFRLDRMWAQGNYDNLTIKLGKIYMDSSYEGHGGGMIMGSRLSGGIVTVGKQLKVTLGGGRINVGNRNAGGEKVGETMMFAEVGGNVNDKFGLGAGFYSLSNEDVYGDQGTYVCGWDVARGDTPFGAKRRNIWKVGFDYKFSPKLVFNAAYARANGDWDTKHKQAYTFELAYNGGRYTDTTKPGSFGAFVAYRHLGQGAVIAPVYDGMYWTSWRSTKGVEIGVSYTFARNIMGTALYFKGKDVGVNEDRDAQQFYGALQFFF